MRAQGRHESLHLNVILPLSEKEYLHEEESRRNKEDEGEGPHAWAEAPSVFRTFYELENRVKLPPKIGDVVLRKGHVLYCNGYVGAHNGMARNCRKA
jgi:hypothetical protein